VTDRNDEIVICRCEEVTLGEIRRWIAKGYHNFDELKRVLRVGMGPCQGRGCREIVLREIAMATGKKVSEIPPGSFRPFTRPVKLGAIVDGADKEVQQ